MGTPPGSEWHQRRAEPRGGAADAAETWRQLFGRFGASRIRIISMNITWLVVTDWNIFNFSSQLTKSYFSDGLKPPTTHPLVI